MNKLDLERKQRNEIKALLEQERKRKEPFIKACSKKIGQIIAQKTYTLKGKRGGCHCEDQLEFIDKSLQKFPEQGIRKAVGLTIKETGYAIESWALGIMLEKIISLSQGIDIKVADTIKKGNNITFKFAHAQKAASAGEYEKEEENG